MGLNESIDKANKRLGEAVNNCIWFSYRTGWKNYLPGTKLNGDVGWGCMIRCGQMLLAKTIQKARRDNSEELKRSIITLCQDQSSEEVSPFGISPLVQHAKIAFGVEPGQWFRSTTIMMSLNYMNIAYNPSLTSDISIFTSVDSLVDLKMLHSRVYKSPMPKEAVDYLAELKSIPWDNSVLLCITVRTGLHKPQKEFKESLVQTICMPQSVGLLAGKDNKAYYVIGNLFC